MVDPGTLENLRRIASGGKVATTNPTHWQNIQAYFAAQLRELELSGSICSVLVCSTEAVNCYGRHIDDGPIFHKLNMTIGRCFIGYPDARQITSWKRGYFVRAAELGAEDPESPGDWVALINIPIPNEVLEIAIPFPRQPLK